MIKCLDKEQRKIIKVLVILVVIICAGSAIVSLNKEKDAIRGEFKTPEMEKNAIEGDNPDTDDGCMYQEAKVNSEYIVHLCANPYYNNNKLNLYLTSNKNNKGLIKVKVLDSNNKVIGETGLINSNSYIKDITLNKKLSNQDKVTIRVMHYEKETYYSLGEIKLDLFVRTGL